MSISKKIINYLDERGYKYEILKHRPTYTALDASQTVKKRINAKIKTEEVAKTLVLKAGKKYFCAVLPANAILDMKKAFSAYKKWLLSKEKERAKKEKLEKIELAKESWMKKNIFGKVGATPPLGGIIGLKIFIDTKIAKQKNIYIGSGEYDYLIKLPTKKYISTEKLIKASIGINKKNKIR